MKKFRMIPVNTSSLGWMRGGKTVHLTLGVRFKFHGGYRKMEKGMCCGFENAILYTDEFDRRYSCQWRRAFGTTVCALTTTPYWTTEGERVAVDCNFFYSGSSVEKVERDLNDVVISYMRALVSGVEMAAEEWNKDEDFTNIWDIIKSVEFTIIGNDSRGYVYHRLEGRK